MAPHREGSERASTWFLRILAAACRVHRLDPAAVFEACSLDLALLDQREARIPLRAARAAWDEAARRSGDPHFGLHAGERLSMDSFDVLGYLGRSVATLGEMFERVTRLASVFTEDGAITLERKPKLAVLRHRARTPQRHVSELMMASLVVRGRELTGTTWSPAAVAFGHAAPADTSEHARIFGCPVRFGQLADELRLPPELLALKLTTYEPGLSTILDDYARQLTARAAPASDLLGDVTEAMTAALARGEPRLEDIARQLTVTPRTLQRRLKDGGTTFQALLDRVRHQLALELIDRDDLPMNKVALQLGFSEPSAFYRAYKRWTGQSPAEARRSRRSGG